MTNFTPHYRIMIASPLRSALAINPICRPESSSLFPVGYNVKDATGQHLCFLYANH